MQLNCYTLLGGQFIGPDYTAEPVPVLDKNGDPVLDRKTKQPLSKLPSKVWNMKETVVSPHDLAARPGSQFAFTGTPIRISFRGSGRPLIAFTGPNTPTRESPATPATVVPASATVPPVPPVPPPTKDEFYTEAELNEMTVADLKNLAAEEEIDLGTAHLKADIVKALLAAKS